MAGMPKWTEILSYWSENNHMIPDFVYFELEKPTCWGCNHDFYGRYDYKRGDKSLKSMAKLWERSPLERAHITPRSLAGSGDASVVPLCKWCHLHAPDVDDPRFFWAWASVQEYEIRREREVLSCMAAFGLNNPESILDGSKFNFGDNKLKEFMHTHAVHHFDGYFGASLSRSTIAAIMVMYLETITGKKYLPEVESYLPRHKERRQSLSACRLSRLLNQDRSTIA